MIQKKKTNQNVAVIKDKSKLNIKFLIVGVIIIAVFGIFGFNKIMNNAERQIKIYVKSTKEKVVDTNELRTVTYTYNGIAPKCKEKCKNDGKDNYVYYVSYKGTVTAGIDFTNLEVSVEDKKVIVTIPEPQITGQNVEVGKFKYIFRDESYNNANEINNAHKLCKDDLATKVTENENIIQTAKESAEDVIREFYEPWLEKFYPDYKLEVK